ncbi:MULTISPECIES: hypothetical protein [unclassified Streptomyces]|uniref:Uncharacterized protein n=1 Tax=Streptomyces sp. R33 TaxID=3238629 RepID=A0AB39Y8Q8_9ACTN|nr:MULTISPECIES: hypothetical protein [unclassified Streptomyces]KJY47789.1 hypothetical protein VR46_01530 [Streptomyces sp. NRRL S-444]KOY57197.1 hypothetical protein ADK59_15045 [Streptomyces sp. XY332]TDU77735.1 hypothetical protein EDD91_4495 [Streptomyces sp. KS 21]THA36930.1 hypothetical protein E6W17_23085 [Streptomyces sp. A1547]
MSTAPASDPQSSQPDPRPEAAPAVKPRPRLVFDDPLDQQSADDTDRGWGERPPSGGSAADLARFLDEKPPHHL